LAAGEVGVDEHGEASGCGDKFTQKAQPLCRHLVNKKIRACQITARPGKAGDKTKPDRISRDGKNDGDRGSCRLRHQRRGRPKRGNRGHLPANQVGRLRRQLVILTVRPSVFDRNVFALDVAGLFEALAERAHAILVCVSRLSAQESDHRDRRLLCARHTRPCDRRAAEQSNEIAPLHGLPLS
jgi:hypothetical protein